MAFITPQGVMKTVVIKYINLCEHGGVPGEEGEHSGPLASRTSLRCTAPPPLATAHRKLWGLWPARAAAPFGWPGRLGCGLPCPCPCGGLGPALLQPWGCMCPLRGGPAHLL